MKDDAMQIALILDRSGSMSAIADATVEGVNAFLAEQQKAAGEVSLRFVQFDDQYDHVYTGLIGQAPLLTLAKEPTADQRRFEPRGWTALLDAIGRTIDEMGKDLAAIAEEKRPAKVVVVIMTDGQENHSKKYKKDQIAEMIARQRESYKWEFQYLGANQDAIQVAAQYNIPAANAVTYAATAVGTRSVMAAASRNVRTFASTGQSATMGFGDEDRAKAMEADDPQPAAPAKP